MVTIADSLAEARQCIQIAEKHSQIFCAVGIHPHNAKEWTNDSERELKEMVQQSGKVRAIGEIGLDYHYDHSSRNQQRDAFQLQLSLAHELSMPAVVHCREAVDDVWSIIDEVKPTKIVLHCCTERFDDVRRFLERGYFLSFTGIATYPNATEIRETIKQCPLEQLMIETDAPYLTPIPYRGKRNEPAFVVEVAKLVAKLKDISLEEVDRATSRNAVEFFRL